MAGRTDSLFIPCWESCDSDQVLKPFREAYTNATGKAEGDTSDPEMVNRLREGEFGALDLININQTWSRGEVLCGKDAPLPDGYEVVQKNAESIRKVLHDTCNDLVACHSDSAPENLLNDGRRAYIDLEFAGNNDPFWDLDDFSVEAAFTPEQDAVFLEAYCGRAPPISWPTTGNMRYTGSPTVKRS